MRDARGVAFTATFWRVEVGAAVTVDGTAVSGLSDMDLIMQLAQLEDSNDAVSSGSMPGSLTDQGADSDDFTLIGRRSATATAAPNVPDRASQELQALEELEKELGLGDMQLFASSAKKDPAKPVSSESQQAAALTTPRKPPVVEEDNLDELEQYLQSLSSPTAT